MSNPPTSDRPTVAERVDVDASEYPTELLNLPWIDVHNHAHTLSWTDREQYALAGCQAMIMVASGNHWIPYKPARAEDFRYLWDQAIDRRVAIARNHFFDPHLAIGIQTGVRVENPQSLLDAMETYCETEAVVAIGETGIRPTQQAEAWEFDEQRAVVEGQMAVAARHDLPVILHTPSRLRGTDREYRDGIDIPGYEKLTTLDQPPVMDADRPELVATQLDIEAASAAGFPENRIVASHADPDNLDYLLAETDCYASFTIGNGWLTGVTVETVAEVIDAYGPDRIMLDTDAANVMRSDVSSIKRAMFELYRLGVEMDAIQQVVLDNPRTVFDIGT